MIRRNFAIRMSPRKQFCKSRPHLTSLFPRIMREAPFEKYISQAGILYATSLVEVKSLYRREVDPLTFKLEVMPKILRDLSHPYVKED